MANTVSAGTINLILSIGENKGMVSKGLCAQVGIDLESLKNPDARIPSAKIQAQQLSGR